MTSTFVFTVYITAQALSGDFAGDGWDNALARLRGAQVRSVVLESYRGGLSLDEDALRAARDRFRAEGFETLGGLMPVWGEGFGKNGEGVETRLNFFCYSSEETVAALEGEIRKLARVFDQVVIDDAYLTSCRCDACDAARDGRPWPEFRRDLLGRVAERWHRAAHEENPRVALTVKFPQYYDRLHLFGYDAARFPQIFDRVWIGTETRDTDTPKYGYTEPYQGYFNARWMRACAGDKFEGAWFDALDCDATVYYEQAISTGLAAPSRIALFSYGQRLFDVLPGVVESKPDLDALAALGAAPRGVHVIKPANSDGAGDLFIFDYLGMMGIPCVPATAVKPDMKSVIVPSHGLADPATADAIAAVLDAGGQVVVTHGALAGLADRPDVLQRFGYAARNIGVNRTETKGFEIDGARIPVERPFRIAGDLEPDADTAVAGYALFGSWSGDRRVPFVTIKNQPSGGRAVVWNLATFGHDAYTIEEYLCVPVRPGLLELPVEVINLLRRTATEPLGFTLEAPARVAVFLGERRAAFVNYTAAPADVRLTGLGIDPGTLAADKPDTTAGPDTLRIAPHGYAHAAVVAEAR